MTVSCNPGNMSIWGHFIHTDSEGAKHPLFIQQGNDCVNGFGDSPEPDSTYAGISAQLSGNLIWPPITSASGTTFALGSGGPTFTDSNGNEVGSGAGSSDSLGRTIVTEQDLTNHNQVLYSVHDSSGGAQTYTVNYSSMQAATSFHVNSGIYGNPIVEGGGTRNVINSILLPTNGTFTPTYTFTYEAGSYGAITEIDLPTGAKINYTWDTFSDLDRTHRYVSSRKITLDSNTSYTWSISRTCYKLNGYCTKIKSTVTDPANNQTVYISQGGEVLSAQIYQGSAVGNPLRQYAIDYQGGDSPNGDDIGGLPIRITTTLDNGQVSKKEFDYEWFNFTYTQCGNPPTYGGCATGIVGTTSRGNVGEIREYDYGTVPGVYGQGTPGGLIRKTDKTYLHNSNANYLTYNIVNKVLQETVYDSSNNAQKAQTQYEYDNYVATGSDLNPLLTASSAAQHDYTHFPTSFIYRGNATRVFRWYDSDNKAHRRSTYQYDELGNTRLIRDALGNATSYTYTDSFANSSCSPPTGENGQAWVSQVTNALTQNVKVVRYPCTGLVEAHKDQNDINVNGAGTTFSYDLRGRMTQKNLPDGGQVATSYNDTPPVTVTATTKITSSLNLVGETIQDGLGRPRKTELTSDPDGTTYTRIAYDGLGRKYQEWNPTRCDPDVNPNSCTGETTFGITTYNYDALNRPTTVVEQDNSQIATTYSANCTTVTDEAGAALESCLDGLGRMTSVVENPGGTPNYETDYQYNVLDNLKQVQQKGGDLNSGAWRTRTFSYNSLSQLITATNPESGSIGYTYDDDGNLSTKTAPLPNQIGSSTVTTTYSYDALNRLTSKTYTGMPMPTIQFGYDGNSLTGCTTSPPRLTDSYPIGRRTSMCDGPSGSGATAWSHDPMGRVSTQSQAQTGGGANVTASTSYGYNLDGSVKSISYPSANSITYTVGGAGRVTQVSDTNNNYVGYSGNFATYAPNGGLAEMTNGHTSGFAGIVISNSYNSRLQPAVLSAANPTQTIFNLSFGYTTTGNNNDNGNVLQIANYVRTDATANIAFTYDAFNRISTASTVSSALPNCWGESYKIDPWGNLTNISGLQNWTNCNTETAANPVGVNNQITGFCYDSAGNLLDLGTCAQAPHNFVYDAEGHLQSPPAVNTASGTLVYTYYYDGDGNRVQKCNANPCNSGSTVGTLYWRGLGNEVLDESARTGSGTMQEEYVYFNGQRIARRDVATGKVYYYLSDHLGSASVIADSSGNVKQQTDHYPYGGIAYTSGNDLNRYKFTGKERDSESSLDYFGARYYASTMGRWMIPDRVNVTDDRILNPGNTLNKYIYGGNNPLKYVDPDGRDIIFFYTPEGPAGHAILLAYDQSTGDSAVKSFGPANHDVLTRIEEFFSIPVPGTDNYGFQDITSADQLREQYASITVQTSPEETQEAITFIQTHPDTGSYITLGHNCTTTCARILRHIKLLKTHDIHPGGLFSHLARSYSTQGNPIFPTLGKDYGNPRSGYSAFDLLFRSIQQQQQQQKPREEVTHKICWTDDNGTQVCQ